MRRKEGEREELEPECEQRINILWDNTLAPRVYRSVERKLLGSDYRPTYKHIFEGFLLPANRKHALWYYLMQKKQSTPRNVFWDPFNILRTNSTWNISRLPALWPTNSLWHREPRGLISHVRTRRGESFPLSSFCSFHSTRVSLPSGLRTPSMGWRKYRRERQSYYYYFYLLHYIQFRQFLD